mmetsp:Transcript_61789/g.121596  ORF Transcript_61789/g.121596 Transcript_61789/m.121596 type:complete len:236 (-) Transcript_61789:684-1391(-)
MIHRLRSGISGDPRRATDLCGLAPEPLQEVVGRLPNLRLEFDVRLLEDAIALVQLPFRILGYLVRCDTFVLANGEAAVLILAQAHRPAEGPIASALEERLDAVLITRISRGVEPVLQFRIGLHPIKELHAGLGLVHRPAKVLLGFPDHVAVLHPGHVRRHASDQETEHTLHLDDINLVLDLCRLRRAVVLVRWRLHGLRWCMPYHPRFLDVARVLSLVLHEGAGFVDHEASPELV